MTYRQRGVKALNILIQDQDILKSIEDYIHDYCDSQDDYFLIIQEVMAKKRSGISDKDILDEVQQQNYLWNTDEYKLYQTKLDEIDNFLINPFEVDEGVLSCHKCGSNKTFSYTKQTRGGDESTTVFVVCSKCKCRWKI